MTSRLSRNTEALTSSAVPCAERLKESFSQVKFLHGREGECLKDILKFRNKTPQNSFAKTSVYPAKLADVWMYF